MNTLSRNRRFWPDRSVEVEVRMRVFCLMLIAGVGSLAFPAMGQEPTAQAPQKKVTIVHTHTAELVRFCKALRCRRSRERRSR
jgi:ferredoxin-NADP reductase